MTTDEEKISRLYQQNKNQGTNEAPNALPNEAPPAKLDSDILKAAHQAVEKKSSKVKSPFSGGWPAAASIAAVLIITVILVPLIKQEAVTPTTKNLTDKQQEYLNQQDVIGRSNAEDTVIEADKQATMKADIKAKRQSLAKEQTRRLAPTLPSRDKSSEITHEPAFADEEAMLGETMPEASMAPVAKDIISAPKPAKPATATMGKSNLYDDEIKTEAELQQQSSPMFAGDKASAITLTPKLWLEKIHQLIKLDKLDLAREELDQFKIRYPDEAIDQSILNNLKH